MDQQQLQELFERYYNRTATPEETAALMALIEQAPAEKIAELIHAQGLQLTAPEPVITPDTADHILQNILTGNSTPVKRSTWWPYAAAAAAILLLIFGITWLMREKNTPPITKAPLADIAPGKESATLTLGDASVITLDTAANGILSKQGNTAVHLVNRQLIYSGSATNTATTYNTISTGRGNHYSMVLSDGTKVWLNSASSLRFPVGFSGKERLVTVTGEVYFEVAADAQHPFQVQLPRKGTITVLGTHFNVHAYDDENDITTTLLQGMVRVNKGSQQQLLQPGQQAIINEQAAIGLRQQVDLAQVMAWKEGYFWFNDTDIYTLMKQIARWYDVEVRFTGTITRDGFSGKISRNVPLSKVLQILELNGIHFQVTGKQITVMP
ncbi:MAG: FecR domain-containing protein [Chitinophaga sp.]|uniref:FecR family protein n=1 Tax=Chitinophaga sp. TaxID=1869181 RepID=UPI001B0249C8|nr:FecR family protein [Chitinophaga sp.]MBO9731558.1 FecR domain-containing protein [Chitinophaga sp.]